MQPGARHCADVNGTFSGEEYAEKVVRHPDCPEARCSASLEEVAAMHELQRNPGVALSTLRVMLRDALRGD